MAANFQMKYACIYITSQVINKSWILKICAFVYNIRMVSFYFSMFTMTSCYFFCYIMSYKFYMKTPEIFPINWICHREGNILRKAYCILLVSIYIKIHCFSAFKLWRPGKHWRALLWHTPVNKYSSVHKISKIKIYYHRVGHF